MKTNSILKSLNEFYLKPTKFSAVPIENISYNTIDPSLKKLLKCAEDDGADISESPIQIDNLCYYVLYYDLANVNPSNTLEKCGFRKLGNMFTLQIKNAVENWVFENEFDNMIVEFMNGILVIPKESCDKWDFTDQRAREAINLLLSKSKRTQKKK